jgi:hypothetical protein
VVGVKWAVSWWIDTITYFQQGIMAPTQEPLIVSIFLVQDETNHLDKALISAKLFTQSKMPSFNVPMYIEFIPYTVQHHHAYSV